MAPMHEISSKSVAQLLSEKYLTRVFIQGSNKLSVIHRYSNFLLKLTLLFILIGVLVPFSPKMPAPGLDPSWALGLNQAVALGLSFGNDIIFTLGPYSSIYTKAYHPATDWMMIGGSVYLACAYWISLILLMRGIKWHWTLFLAISLLVMIYARDSLLFIYPLLVGLIGYKIISINEARSKHISPIPLRTKLAVAFLFTPFGLLPLIKGSLLILCLTIVLLCTLFFLWHKHTVLVFISLISPLVSMMLFWIGAGQAITYLPHYLITSLALASDFTEAMAFTGNNNEIIIYLCASLLICLSIIWQKQLPSISRLFLLCLFFVFLFLSFKTGFTRHYGHAFIASTSILIAALLLPYLFHSKITIPVILFCLYTANYITAHYTQISVYKNILSTYSSVWHGLKSRLTNKNWLSQNFALSLSFMKQQAAFPKIQGTTDIYSYNQAYLIASEINWTPRPVFQSYSVFTPWLAKKNKAYLLSERRPDNIIFKIEPIDGRLPSLEDGMSWPLLLNTYQPTQLINDFLFLRKRNASPPVITLVAKEQHALGEVIKVPHINHPLLLEINIKPTIYGLLALTFFKPNPLLITIELKSGIKKQYRLITNMAKAEFLISPLIESTQEFALLYDNHPLLANKQVNSISIISESNHSYHWQEMFTILFKKWHRLEDV